MKDSKTSLHNSRSEKNKKDNESGSKKEYVGISILKMKNYAHNTGQYIYNAKEWTYKCRRHSRATSSTTKANEDDDIYDAYHACGICLFI